MSGKGDKQRPGTGYADNWEATFGKKAKSEQALQELTDLSQELGLYDGPKPSGGQIWMLKSAMESPYMEQAAAARALADAQKPNLMTLSEAMKAKPPSEAACLSPSTSYVSSAKESKDWT